MNLVACGDTKENDTEIITKEEAEERFAEKYFEFELNEDGNGYIITDFLDYKYDELELTIPSNYKGLPVLEIKDNSFKGLDIEKLTLPNNLEVIGTAAFFGCDSLKEIEFPSSLWEIDTYAFEECDALIDLAIPAGTCIEFGAFQNCDSLKTVTLGGEEIIMFAHIAKYAFHECTSLETVHIGEGYTSIGENAFSYCDNLKIVEIPSTMATIGSCAFEHCESLEIMRYNASEAKFGNIESGPWWLKDTGSFDLSNDLECTD